MSIDSIEDDATLDASREMLSESAAASYWLTTNRLVPSLKRDSLAWAAQRGGQPALELPGLMASFGGDVNTHRDSDVRSVLHDPCVMKAGEAWAAPPRGAPVQPCDQGFVAEEVGFEPTEPLRVHGISSAAH